MNVDPDGIAFFTEGSNATEPSAGSVFGAMPEGHLERMLNLEGSEEVGSRFLPDSVDVSRPRDASQHVVAVPDHPISLHPALTRGTPEWRLDFVLNGPASADPVSPTPATDPRGSPVRRLRLISGYRGTPEGDGRQNSASAAHTVPTASGGEEES
jgi:hypothetical protein